MIKRAFCVMMICLLHTLWTAGSTISGMAKDEQLLLDCFNRFSYTQHLGVGQAEYPLFAAQLSAFFRHETDTPHVAQHPFHDYEVMHLFDVRTLLDNVSRVALVCLCGTLLFVLLTIYLMRRKRTSLWPGCIAYLALLAIVTLYFVCDFGHAFTLMHELLFTNDLWLLNPQTDLLSALMPEDMFIFLAKKVLMRVLPLLIAIPIFLPFPRKNAQPRQ